MKGVQTDQSNKSRPLKFTADHWPFCQTPDTGFGLVVTEVLSEFIL
jgi:hypothetical protein